MAPPAHPHTGFCDQTIFVAQQNMYKKTFRFTKSRLEEIPPAGAGKRAEYRDTEVPGLILRVTGAGAKTFCVSRKRRGEHFRVTLGRFPDLTVDNARMLAIATLGEMAITKANPNDQRRQEQKKQITLQAAFDERLRVRGYRVKDATAAQYRSLLTNYSGDWLSQPIMNITRERVERRHRAITDGTVWFGKDKSNFRSGVGTGSKAQADSWGRALRAVCRFAWDHYRDDEGRSLLPEPPTMVLSTKRQWHGLVRKTERVRNNDLGRWFAAITKVREQAEAERDDFAHSVCDAIWLAMFSGLRKSEITELTWDRVNLGGRYFWIHETKNGDPHELPITKTLLQLFRRRLAYRHDDCPLVFPGRAGGVIGEPRKAIKRIVAATVPEPNPDNLPMVEFKFHDARRTYGSAAALARLDQYIIKRLMNHRTTRSADVTQGYLHFGADELQESAETVEHFLLEKAGLVECRKSIDMQLSKILDGLSEEEKRELIFNLSRGEGREYGV